MEILFLSHCVPNPPDKGERIRAFHELEQLSRRHRVHLACFARDAAEAASARELEGRCASVDVEVIPYYPRLARALAEFAMGACLNKRFYFSPRMRRRVRELAVRIPLSATLAYSAVMAQYAPADVPLVLDMLDVDSEKWFEYSRARRPRLLFATEAERYRRAEIEAARRATANIFTTAAEAALFRSFAPGVPVTFMENGVDFDYFDPAACPDNPGLAGRRYAVFVGSMDYYPNIEAACWFADSAFAELRRGDTAYEFFVVGRKPGKRVQALARRAGVHVTGGVPDVRPYLKHATAVVTPLQIARGIQNKVLEALAMGKRVLASPAVANTFGNRMPVGVAGCATAGEYLSALTAAGSATSDEDIRAQARQRFSWAENLNVALAAVEAAADSLGLSRTRV